jgi:hypothetical protein
MKVLGCISVDLDVIDRLLIRYSVLVRLYLGCYGVNISKLYKVIHLIS